MEKYRIAVGVPTLKDASNEAIACSEHLKKKGIHAEWDNLRYFFCVDTNRGIIEFIPYENFKIEYIFSGKTYTTMFNVPEDAEEIVRIAGDRTTCQCFLDWVEEKNFKRKKKKLMTSFRALIVSRSIYSDEGTEEKVEVKEDERNV